MKGDQVFMSQKQLQRFRVIGIVEEGGITLEEAAVKMAVSYRHAKRILKRVREKGAQGLIHGNTGRSPHNRIYDELKKNVLDLSGRKYAAFNDRHFREELAEMEGIVLGRETIRKLRRAANIPPKRKRRPPRHRKRRERKAQEGWMILWDGSPHPWFGPAHPPCCLLVALDDATGTILAARFFAFEGTEGYLWLLAHIVRHYGIPISIYQDRHGSLKRNDHHWTLEEELAGRQEPTHVGQALDALGIQPIFALSAQAKGRIERLFATLQDRLGAQISLSGISTLAQANDLLPRFIKRHNRRFALPAQNAQKAWRTVPPNLDVDRLISFHYCLRVALDNTVRVGKVLLDIPPGPYRMSYAKAYVEVRQLLDGTWRIYYKDHLIAQHAPTTLHEPLRALPRKPSNAAPSRNYNWIYQASAQSDVPGSFGHTKDGGCHNESPSDSSEQPPLKTTHTSHRRNTLGGHNRVGIKGTY